MKTVSFGPCSVTIDFGKGTITSFRYSGTEFLRGVTPLFRAGFRDEEGTAEIVSAADGVLLEEKDGTASYAFGNGITVTVSVTEEDGAAAWRGAIERHAKYTPEWMELPLVSLPPLKGEGGNASILYPFNEGAIVESVKLRQSTGFRSQEPAYPSHGSYPMFPYMACSQYLAYLYDGHGIYLGAHDPARGVKAIDFSEGADGGVEMRIRVWCGCRWGETWEQDFPVVWRAFEGGWEASAEIYREWFETALPPRAKKIKDNPDLPDWYEDAPLVVSYPVRGVHDMDEMKPNALFPYVNALPVLDDIRNTVRSRLLVLLMHWEGTAPWAPPFVWPPFGGEEGFLSFRDALHERGDLLGVYCSGFGFTIQSNLIKDYDNRDRIRREGLGRAMCAGPDGVVAISRICPGQRSGYDICAASEEAKPILEEAYHPLLTSGIDYAQILDQNHGGSQYFCYSKEHGHPPVPGKWMTENMQKLLTGWNSVAPKTLLGCESAAAEPYIGNLLFSDNRFELNWIIGRPVPAFAYVYHEYLRNFMGNQVSSPFPSTENSFFMRLAYAFSAGDCMTLVMTPDGRFMDHWGGTDFNALPDRDEVLAFTAALADFYRGDAHEFLYRGRMIAPIPCDCGTVPFRTHNRTIDVPRVFTTAWEADGKRAQVFVNHTKEDVVCDCGDRSVTVPTRNAALIML